ncbi:hypothetical protein F4809DRAFT_430410 [Biscogniauxia mediterranea]|nr:hypothetical protein F4809DRAFT_430410 [Biscogniauxia mediterranea]
MKVFVPLVLLAGLVSATTIPRRSVERPQEDTDFAPLTAASVPAYAPEGYSTAVGQTSLKSENINLLELPAELVNRNRALRRLRGLEDRQVTSQDFYECTSSNPAPAASDCDVVISQVFAVDQSLTITASSCLLFQYGTCWGFFCSLCQQLSTSTSFIGGQLSTAESLCISNSAGGQTGTVVGEDAPQWQAGFVYQGRGLPNYADVC